MNDQWSIKKIKDGFERFRIEHSRLPTSPEIDKLDYLPSSRQIQRKFGGLEKLRGILGYEDTHFGRGKYRSDIATRTNVKGRDTELALEKILREKFGEVFVHTERIFDDSKNRVDFYIYTADGNFGIDVFYTDTMRDLQKNINNKIDKYLKFPGKLFFVVGNGAFTQSELDAYMTAKKKSLPANTTILNIESLGQIIKPMRVYPDPINQ